MGQHRPGSTNGRGTDADWLANSILAKRLVDTNVCCARCRRGMPGMQGACGYDMNCGCHTGRRFR